ncbi:uncharacterized protein BX663DRAFT_509416 [Cokeromyces recurvatus]|uniref:uncharacterized protein n=1 Tax=Cokeromyces recurvatus TaxID=90255 RepID=UPI00221F4FF6|nr:uncharacterized protein BX663DRAFT_509416 [Cokeromyces recurvatus]KAI7903058.1 hypothetical protein BX663DRAFT_509416 [Cokeromyces recurvatus]
MPSTTRLSHRHQSSNLSFSSASSSSSSTRPALPQILSNSATNAVNFTRSAAPTSRRVRSHWFTHFVLNWRRSSRSSKLWMGFSMTFVIIQIITSIIVLLISWEMYCDKPLRVFVTVYILRQILITPIHIYQHLAPRRRPTSSMISPRSSARTELSEAYALNERNIINNDRPVSFPPPVRPTSTNRYHQAFATPHQQLHLPSQYPTSSLSSAQITQEDIIRAWIDRAKSALDLFAVLWFIIGNYMLFSSTTCSDTAKPLYYLSLGLIAYGYLILSVPIFLCTSVIFCLPCVLVGMRLLHVDDGVYMGGATNEEIAMIPVYQFKSTSNNNTSETANQIKLLYPNNNSKLNDSTTVYTTGSTLNENDTIIDLNDIKQKEEEKKGQKSIQKKLGRLDKLWLYLGLIDSPPTDINEEYEILEIPDVQDQLCVICLSNYEDNDILCKLW